MVSSRRRQTLWPLQEILNMSDKIQKMTPPGQPFSIFGIPANINYFLNVALTPDTVDGIENRQSTVKAHVRRRYVGDINGSNVSSHQREYLYDPGRKTGSALPGFTFTLDDEVEKRSFTLQGDVMDLHSFLSGGLKADCTLYTQGASYEIKATEAG